MKLRTVATVAVVALALTGLGACGNSGPGSTSETTTQPTTSSSSASSVEASLPVVTCQTTFAVTTTTTSLPSTLSVRVPSRAAGDAGDLAVYSDPAGIMLLLGPKDGWTCHGLYGADGSGGLLVSPMGESVPADPDAGWHVGSDSPTEAIVGYETGASPVAAAALACPLSADAAAALQRNVGKACSARPATETVLSSSSVQVAFYDPAGTAGEGMPSGGNHPANGVLLYEPESRKASAYLATCTLPTAQSATCSAVLQHFIALYG